jgi:hypothetical protein
MGCAESARTEGVLATLRACMVGQLSRQGRKPVEVLAAEAGQPVETFVERVLQGLVDADIEIRDGIPVFRMPPDAPVLTSADVDRLLHSDLRP